MEIYVIEDDVIENIQRDFQRYYPHLKLQFYKNPHQEGQPSPTKELLQSWVPIEDVVMFHTSGKIDISPLRSVAEVEHDFFHTLGLCVQIFRQFGDTWLETTITDHWSLQQQEEKGKENVTKLMQK